MLSRSGRIDRCQYEEARENAPIEALSINTISKERSCDEEKNAVTTLLDNFRYFSCFFPLFFKVLITHVNVIEVNDL